MTDQHGSGRTGTNVTEGLHAGRLSQEAQNFIGALADRAVDTVSAKLSEATDKLIDRMDQGGPGVKSAVSGLKALAEGKSPFRAVASAGAAGIKEKVKQIFRGGKGKKGLKLVNIVETLDVGVPMRLAYNQWTQYEDFPSFTKKVEHAEHPEDEKVNWKAQIWWSHRSWESTIIEQVPDDHIVWRSKGPKGYADGAVTFSELAPNLTRIMLVMEYHPQGLFEHTGNLWRAQGRRARLEFKHFRRHVMAHAILKPDEIEGWRGEIRDGQVMKTHEEALEEEQRARGEAAERAGAPEEEEGPEEKRAEGEEEPEEYRAEREEVPEEEGEERRAAREEVPEEEGEERRAAREEEPEEEGEEEREEARAEPPAEEGAEEYEEPPRARRPVRRRLTARRRPTAEPEEEEEPEPAPPRARSRVPRRRPAEGRAAEEPRRAPMRRRAPARRRAEEEPEEEE
jgi:uncharacterized membrane protein